MQSLINKKNASRLPYSFLFLFLFLYICPNIKYFGVGEMSYLPSLIIIFAYSFLSKMEGFKYLCIVFIYSIWPLFLLIKNQIYDYSFIATLISLYLLIVPILSSILLGRIIGLRISQNSKENNLKEFKKTFLFISLILFFTGLLNKIDPSLLRIILHTGRTSFGRWTFFFTEPSQGSSVLLIFWFASLFLLFRKNFYDFFGKDKNLFLVLIPAVTILFTYLSLPTTLLAQLGIFFSINIFIFLAGFLKNIFLNLKVKIIKISNWKMSIHNLYALGLFFSSFAASFYLLIIRNSKLLFFLRRDVLQSQNLILSTLYIGGFRFFYSFAAIVSSLENPLSFPGSWYGRFVQEMLNILSNYRLEVSDEFLQLFGKNVLRIKPLGWFYFSIYDLGIIGLCIFFLIFLYPYIKFLLKGIINAKFLQTTLFSAQISLLLIPILPSTPSVFFPLLIYSLLDSYNKNNKLNLISKPL